MKTLLHLYKNNCQLFFKENRAFICLMIILNECCASVLTEITKHMEPASLPLTTIFISLSNVSPTPLWAVHRYNPSSSSLRMLMRRVPLPGATTRPTSEGITSLPLYHVMRGCGEPAAAQWRCNLEP